MITLQEAVTSVNPKYRWHQTRAGFYVESVVCPLLRGFGHTRDEAADGVWDVITRFGDTDAAEWKWN